MREGWADSAGVRVHYVEHRPQSSSGVPAVVVPGFSESASEYEWLLRALAPRHAMAVSVRGRGRSDAPPTGYDLDEHVADLEAVVDELGLRRFALVGYSRGSSYAMGLALRRPTSVAGLVIGDYHARHVALPEGWAEWFFRTRWRGVPTAERVARHVLDGLEREAVERPFWDELRAAPFPILVLRGDQPGSLITDEVAEQWRSVAGDGRVVTLPGRDHDLWGPDPGPYTDAIRSFLEELDGRFRQKGA